MSLLDHPIIDKIQAAKRRTVALRFGIEAEGNLLGLLSLHDYLEKAPERFFVLPVTSNGFGPVTSGSEDPASRAFGRLRR